MIMWTNISSVLVGGLLLLGPARISAQGETESMRSTTHVFWQPGDKLKVSDYRRPGGASEREILYCDSIELCTSASVGLWYKLDIPKRKRDRGKQPEKVYIVPAFEYATSHHIRDTPTGLQKEQVIFDICELAARKARRELERIHDSIPLYGVDFILLETVMADVKELRSGMVDGFVRDVYIQRQEGAFDQWRKVIDDLLEESKVHTTSLEDCQRFMYDRPLLDGYIESPKVMGAMKR